MISVPNLQQLSNGNNRMDKFNFNEKLNLALSYESLGKNLHSIQIYTRLIIEDKSYVDGYISLINLYEKEGRIEEALNVLEHLLENNHHNDYALIYSTEFLLKHEYWEKALIVLIKIDSTVYPIVHYWRGLCNYNLKNYFDAKTALEQLRKTDDKYEFWVHVLFLLAAIEFEMGNLPGALEYAKKMEFVDSDNKEINLLLAKIYFNLDMNTHAEEKIRKAIKLKQADPETLETAAKIYFKSGDYKKSGKYFSLLLESTDELSAEVYYYIAAIANEAQDFDKAELYYKLALKIDSSYNPALDALNYLTSQKTGKTRNE